jgi:hypothetical protein
MTARLRQSLPDDPSEVLGVLPVKWHQQFLDEYRGALDAAREVRCYPEVQDVLQLWRLRAVAYSGPSFDQALLAAREDRVDEFVTAEQAMPGWSDRT